MLPGSDRHGVNVRVRDGRVLFNVVRLDEDGRRDLTADRAAEQRFCAITGQLSEVARTRGCELNLQTADAVTPGKLQVVTRYGMQFVTAETIKNFFTDDGGPSTMRGIAATKARARQERLSAPA